MLELVVQNSLRTDSREANEAVVKVYPHQAVLRSSPHALSAVTRLASTLLEVEIRSCGLTSGDVLRDCVHLRVACLADNQIGCIPKCLHRLRQLRILDVAHNDIASLKDVSNLRLASSTLTYINLTGNAVTSTKKYRRNVYNLVPSISALDSYIITDTETLAYTNYNSHVKIRSSLESMKITKNLHMIHLSEDKNQAMKFIDTKCVAITQIRKALSPAGIIQRSYRRYLSARKEDSRYEAFVAAIVKLQAMVRAFLWSRKLQREIDAMVEQENITVTVIKTMARVNQLKFRSRQLVRWVRSCINHRRTRRHCVHIQRWFRRALRYHKGVLLWLQRKCVTGILFTKASLPQVRMCLAAYPASFVKYRQVQVLLHGITPCQHLMSVRSGREDIFRRKESLKRLSGLSSKACPRKDVSVYSLRYATEPQRRRCGVLRRRGVHYPPSRAKEFRPQSAQCPSRRAEVDQYHQEVFQLSFPDDLSFLLKVYKLLRRQPPGCDGVPVYFNSVEMCAACAIDIQRVWRSFITRKVISPMFVSSVIARRSVIAVQRWWRYINGLSRRLTLLRDISVACRVITSTSVYLDAWVYYHLLRCYSPPNNQPQVVSSFPEFKGIPVFDDNGYIAMQPYRVRSCFCSDFDITIPTVAGAKARMCIPRWASWRPRQQLAPASQPPLTHHVVLFSVLTRQCDVSLQAFEVPFKTAKQVLKVRPVRVVELKFRTVLEAQTRCAMLMLLTYDVKSHTSVTMMPERLLRMRLRAKAPAIIHSRALVEDTCVELSHRPESALGQPLAANDDERELYPIETQVLLCPSPVQWLVDVTQPASSADVVRFQFLCECLVDRERGVKSDTSASWRVEGMDQHVLCAHGNVETTTFAGDGIRHRPATAFIPLADYRSRDDSRIVFHSFGTEEGRECPAACTQQLFAVPKTRIQRERPKSAAAGRAVGATVRPDADHRFRDKLWSKERVLLWCSNFDDTAFDHMSTPRTPATGRPRSARDGRVSISAAETRLRTVTLSTAAKTLGKFRCDAVPAPVLAPPTLSREDFLAAQSQIKRLDVRKAMQQKSELDERRRIKHEKELEHKKQGVVEAKASKVGAASRVQEWRAVKSAKARRRHEEASKATAEVAAALVESEQKLKKGKVRREQQQRASTKAGSQYRQDIMTVRATLNTIVSKTTKKARSRKETHRKSHQTQSKCNPPRNAAGGRKPTSECMNNCTQPEDLKADADHTMATQGQLGAAGGLYGTIKHIELSRNQQKYATAMQHVLLARYKTSSSKKNKRKGDDAESDFSDDDSEHSLSLCSRAVSNNYTESMSEGAPSPVKQVVQPGSSAAGSNGQPVGPPAGDLQAQSHSLKPMDVFAPRRLTSPLQSSRAYSYSANFSGGGCHAQKRPREPQAPPSSGPKR